MANLSNINNILRVSSSGVGINKNNTGPSELDIESAGADIIDMTRTNLKTYRFAISGASAFSLFDVAAGVDRLTIDSSGNSTFAGNVSITKASTPELILTDTTNNVNLLIAVDDANTFLRSSSGAPILFQTNAGTTALTLDASQNSTFAGNLNVPYGKGYFMDTTGAGGSNFVKTINDYETVIGTDRGSAGFAVVGNSNIRIGFGQAYTAAQTKLFINSSGNVGIGQTPYSYARLLTEGSDNTSSNYAFIAYNQNTDAILACRNDGQVTMPTGNVGIGTPLPTAKLHITEQAESNYFLKLTGTLGTGNTYGFKTNGGDSQVLSLFDVTSTNRLAVFGNTEIRFATGGTERFLIDSGGNVGIGATSPKGKLDVFRVAGQSSVCAIAITNGESNNRSWGISTEVRKAGDFAILCSPSASTTPVPTDDNIRLYLQSGGDVSMAMQDYNANPSATNYGLQLETGATGKAYWQSAVNAATSHYHYEFINTNGSVGTIRTLNSATSYVTTSDYRLKEDLQNFEGLEMVSRIPVYDFKWKIDDTRSYGVMAHELQEVLPDGVSGEKDAEEMQGVDYSKIVPLLVKSIQELKAEIELLKSK